MFSWLYGAIAVPSNDDIYNPDIKPSTDLLPGLFTPFENAAGASLALSWVVAFLVFGAGVGLWMLGRSTGSGKLGMIGGGMMGAAVVGAVLLVLAPDLLPWVGGNFDGVFDTPSPAGTSGGQ